MSTHDPLNEAQRERLESCLDGVEEAKAHLLAAQAPEAWVDTGQDGADFDLARAASEYSLEAEVAAELLTPLDAETRGRIVDGVLGSYLAETGDEAPAVAPAVAPAANDAGRPRRWWQLPMTAAAAVLLTLFYVDLRGREGAPADSFDGSVLLTATNRAGSQPRVPAATMRIRADDHFAIHCQAEGRTVDIIGVRAEPIGGGKVHTLASEELDVGPDGAVLKARADLAKGSWTVSCDSHERSSGTRRLLGPPATLIVE